VRRAWDRKGPRNLKKQQAKTSLKSIAVGKMVFGSIGTRIKRRERKKKKKGRRGKHKRLLKGRN